jgi:hypothetical protein
MDWKKANPEQYAMYFHCKTKLVDTFKELYRDVFKFEGNRVKSNICCKFHSVGSQLSVS